jgi:hypothetical protein
MPRYLRVLILSAAFGVTLPLAGAWAGDANACIDQCFSTFSPSADCPDCTESRDECVAQCSKVGPSFGAIAYGRGSGAWGSSYQWDSREKAESTAMANCQKYAKDCEVMVWFSDQCGAVAAEDGGDAYWGLGDGEGAAREDAMNKCAKGGGRNCQVQASQCSR